MRFRVLVPVALLLSACTKRSDETRPASAADSSEVVTELSPAGESTAVARQSASAANASPNLTLPKSTSPETAVTAPPAPSKQPQDYGCGIRNAPVLTSLGVGNLQIGRTIAVVKQTCRVIRDEDEMNEGNRERILTVMIGDDPVRVTVDNGLVSRIALRSPRFETRDGLHIGTTLSRLTARGGAHLFEGRDGLYVTLASHCGLSFRFSIPSRETPGKAWTVAHLVQRHGSAVADRIFVSRCLAWIRPDIRHHAPGRPNDRTEIRGMGGTDTVERLFIATPLTEQARDKIAAALPPLPGRPVPAQNWHFTLRFLGDTERERRDQLALTLRRTRLGRSFSIRFDGLGAFPRARRARIIWLGVTDGARELVSLAEAVESAVRRSDFPAEERPFKPHLTLSRVEPPRAVADILAAQPALEITMLVSEVVLVRSSLGAGPAKYEVVEKFLLGESK